MAKPVAKKSGKPKSATIAKKPVGGKASIGATAFSPSKRGVMGAQQPPSVVFGTTEADRVKNMSSNRKRVSEIRKRSVGEFKVSQDRVANDPKPDDLITHPVALYRASEQQRIIRIKSGVAANVLDTFAERMQVSKETLFEILDLPRSTIGHKIRQNQNLDQGQAEKIVGLATLIGNVQDLAENGGDSAGFDAYRWVATWMRRPIPALGDKTPAEYMDTMTGQGIVSNLIEMTRAGAFA